MDTEAGLWIYRASAPGQWDLVDQIADQPPDHAHTGIYAFDVNQNGRPELIWAGYPTTLIFERRGGTSDARESPRLRPGSLAAFPTPCRLQAHLRVEGSTQDAARLDVYDVAGRLVERRSLMPDSDGRILWPTQHLSSGVYLLRLENTGGQALAVGRGIVAR